MGINFIVKDAVKEGGGYALDPIVEEGGRYPEIKDNYIASVIEPEGLAINVENEFRHILRALSETGRCNLVLDLENIGYIDSGIENAIISAKNVSFNRGGDLRIVADSNEFSKNFFKRKDINGGVYPSVDEAIRSYVKQTEALVLK